MRKSARRLQKALGPCATVIESMSKLPGLEMLGLVSEAAQAAEHVLGFATE